MTTHKRTASDIDAAPKWKKPRAKKAQGAQQLRTPSPSTIDSARRISFQEHTRRRSSRIRRSLHARMLHPSQVCTRIVPRPLRRFPYTSPFHLHPPPPSPFQPTSRLLHPHAHPPHLVLLQNNAVVAPALRVLPQALSRDRRRQCRDRTQFAAGRELRDVVWLLWEDGGGRVGYRSAGWAVL
jgi:hypothetical protein